MVCRMTTMREKHTSTPTHSAPPLADLRALLCDELARRCRTNPQYSMRAFAKSLGLSHSLLSMVIAQKRPISRKLALNLADRLNLDPSQRRNLIQTHASPKSARKSRVTDWHQVELDTFNVVCDWYHYAILSLLELPDAKFEQRWIAGRLSISQTEAKLAMERLARLGLVREVNGRWKQAVAQLRTDNVVSTATTRQFHRQLLQRALHSLDNDPFERRVFAAMTMAVNDTCVPTARIRIDELKANLTQELEEGFGAPNHVYKLLIQFVPVTSASVIEASLTENTSEPRRTPPSEDTVKESKRKQPKVNSARRNKETTNENT